MRLRPFLSIAPVALCVASLAGCGSGEAPPPATPKAAAAPPPAAPEPGPTESVSRAAVDAAIKAGLGKFLANVEVEPSLDGKGKFVGWRVVALHGAMWEGVDLRVGDVVTRLNGFEIERDAQADKAFRSLAVASEIRVSLLRDGKPTELRFAIVE